MGEGEDDFGELTSQLAALGLTLKQVGLLWVRDNSWIVGSYPDQRLQLWLLTR